MNEIGEIPPRGRQTMAVFDFDGTLTRYDSFLRYLIDFSVAHPLRVARMWHLPLDVLRFKLGLRDNSWLKQRFLAAILGGLGDNELRRATQRFLDQLLADGLRDKARAVLEQHHRQGHRTVLLSASPDFYIRQAAERLGFSDCVCTVVERDREGRITGRLDGANCYGPEKVRRFEELIGPERKHWHVVAYGDHGSDFPLLQSADQGFLINPSAALAEKAANAKVDVLFW